MNLKPLMLLVALMSASAAMPVVAVEQPQQPATEQQDVTLTEDEIASITFTPEEIASFQPTEDEAAGIEADASAEANSQFGVKIDRAAVSRLRSLYSVSRAQLAKNPKLASDAMRKFVAACGKTPGCTAQDVARAKSYLTSRLNSAKVKDSKKSAKKRALSTIDSLASGFVPAKVGLTQAQLDQLEALKQKLIADKTQALIDKKRADLLEKKKLALLELKKKQLAEIDPNANVEPAEGDETTNADEDTTDNNPNEAVENPNQISGNQPR